MATKADLFRYQQERSGPKKAPQTKVRRDIPVNTSLPGVSATDRRAGAGKGSAARNVSQRAAKNAVYKLEDSATGKPSRRSTRKSANSAKPTHSKRSAKVRAVFRSAR